MGRKWQHSFGCCCLSLKQAAPLFQQLAKEFPSDIAAQMAVATAAPHIETPRIDPLSGKKLRPGALTIQEEMGTADTDGRLRMPSSADWQNSERFVLEAIADIKADMAESRKARETQNIELAVLKTKVLVFSGLMSFVGSAVVTLIAAFLKVR
jgi:hypothetical protein